MPPSSRTYAQMMHRKEFDLKLGVVPLYGSTGVVLGHEISRKGIEVDKVKIEIIAKLPTPKCVKDIRSFLGHAGFYRRFIKDFSKIARPLISLLAKDVPFIFDDECLNAWEKLKMELISAPIVSISTPRGGCIGVRLI